MDLVSTSSSAINTPNVCTYATALARAGKPRQAVQDLRAFLLNGRIPGVSGRFKGAPGLPPNPFASSSLGGVHGETPGVGSQGFRAPRALPGDSVEAGHERVLREPGPATTGLKGSGSGDRDSRAEASRGSPVHARVVDKKDAAAVQMAFKFLARRLPDNFHVELILGVMRKVSAVHLAHSLMIVLVYPTLSARHHAFRMTLSR
jgi:hypothetical protein